METFNERKQYFKKALLELFANDPRLNSVTFTQTLTIDPQGDLILNPGGSSKQTKSAPNSNKTKTVTVSIGCQLWLRTSTGCLLSANVMLQSEKKKIAVNSQDFPTISNEIITNACQELSEDLNHLLLSKACVDEYTADQLLIYMAMATGTSAILMEPNNKHSSLHVETAIAIASQITGANYKQFEVTSYQQILELLSTHCPRLTLPTDTLMALTASESGVSGEEGTSSKPVGLPDKPCKLILCDGIHFNADITSS